VVDVLQEQVDGREPLREAAFERVPLAAGENARQQVEREDALGPLVVAVHCEGDACVRKARSASS